MLRIPFVALYGINHTTKGNGRESVHSGRSGVPRIEK